jgi:hypothetical protein
LGGDRVGTETLSFSYRLSSEDEIEQHAVLAVVAPKNDDEELALGNQFFSALGLPLRGHWSNRKPKLMGYLYQYGTKCLIVDDAHDLSLEHLMFLNELTDQG